MTTDSLLVEVRGDATWLGVNRPDKRNALDVPTSHALREFLEQAESGEPTVLVLHSTTPGIFVSGTDIASLAARGLDEALVPINVRLFAQLAGFRWPTIAVIDGPAYGGGLELALACDLRVATPAARFAMPEPSLGIMAGAGGNWRLNQLVGLGLTRRMLYTGDVVGAQDALAAGLVDRLVEPDETGSTVAAMVESIARRSWRALELTKLAIGSTRTETTAFDMVAQGLLYESTDKAERMRAFLNRKRSR
ncbi:MAG TPA: enoyl-CoA hydratase/isomerase family protein [Pseudonocardiaceae bacterium]|jgi:enoyl-CoA hydratase/carnithine racemase